MARGVGARQAARAPGRGGGGYLNGCTPPELSSDPRYRELAEIGLAPVWLMTAHHLGFDRWMDLWRQLSSDERVLTDDRQILLHLRDFGFYARLQRNLYIRRLQAAGLQPQEIYAMVHRHLGDSSTFESIKRVTKGAWAAHKRAAQVTGGLSPYLVEQIRLQARQSPDLFPVALEHALVAESCRDPAAAPAGQAEDPRLDELADIGLSATWRDVARLIGYDDFVTLWRRWSSMPELRAHNQIELRLRPVRSFERYQRNRYIETLVAAGLKPSQIYQMLQKQLGEQMSFRHLMRLVAAGRVSE